MAGDPADFDFRADLEAIAANLRRAEKIRTVTEDAWSIRDFSQADKQMLHDAKVEIAKLQNSVKQRVELIGINMPLPTKIVTQVLKPIDIVTQFGEDPDVDEVDVHVRRVMQKGLDELAAKRRFPILG